MNGKVLNFFDWIFCRVADYSIRVTPFLLRRRQIDSVGGKKIIFVFANDLLGDTLVKIPFFIALRKEYPKEKFHITIVLSPSNAQMISALGCADEIIEENPLHWNHAIFWIFTKNGFLAKSLRWAIGHKAYVAILCHRSRSLGCDFVIRLCSPAISAAYAVDMTTPIFPMSAKYQVKVFDGYYSYLLKSLDGRHQIEDMGILLSKVIGHDVRLYAPTYEQIEPMLDFSVADSLPGDYIVIVPGARVKYRRWPIERFSEMVACTKNSIVVVGSKEESYLSDEIIKISKKESSIFNLCGKTTLSQLGGVLLRACLVVTNETGTANYASIIGAKTLCILGGGDFGAFMPNFYCKDSFSIYKMRDCFNCGWKCKEMEFSEENTAPCIKAISVEEVKAVMQKFL